ncbi:MAG: dicarboxylate/amino acid:cation symporter [Planctomycetota bacterium]|nr:dicarboxylate/amino acid:cation symporter [Planctomycetota bacterium]
MADGPYLLFTEDQEPPTQTCSHTTADEHLRETMSHEVSADQVPENIEHDPEGGSLFLQIFVSMAAGVALGLLLGSRPTLLGLQTSSLLLFCQTASKLVLQLLAALATPLILVAVSHVLMTSDIKGKQAGRLVWLLISNTLIAIFIGLLVMNILQPGQFAKLPEPNVAKSDMPNVGVLDQMLNNIPKSLLGPLGDSNNVLGTIVIAVAFGIAMRDYRDKLETLVETALKVILRVIGWVIQLVPLAVFLTITHVVGKEGFEPFVALGGFTVTVLIGLFLQVSYYMARIRINSWPRPAQVLHAMRDALVMAFSTGSSTITMPVTFNCLRQKLGLREQSASMGALVGANFNNDGTALYEAMAALFISQMLGRQLDLSQQLLVVITSVVASVGAAGIPRAGLVTMTLVFRAVNLPPEYITILFAVDWFLDRCRTMVNVMGDVTVSCILDGKESEEAERIRLENQPGFPAV